MSPFWIVGIFVVITGLVVVYQFSLLLGLVTFVAGVVIIVGYMLMAPKYPVNAQIFERRSGTVRIKMDKASRMRDDNDEDTYYYKFKKAKTKTKAVRYDNLYPSGSKEVAIFYSPAPGEYYPAVFDENVVKKKVKYWDPKDLDENNNPKKDAKQKEIDVENTKIKPISDELLGWMVLKQKRMKQKYMTVSVWDKYYPLVVIAVLMVCIMLIISSLFQGLGPVTESFDRAAKIQSDASTRLAIALETWLEHEEGVQKGDPSVPNSGVPPPPDAD